MACSHAIDLGKAEGYENAGNGACICLDCTNGEILGMASAPTFRSVGFCGWHLFGRLVGFEQRGRADGRFSTVPFSGQYMSASTIKVLSALAGLEYGTYTSTQTTVLHWYWTGNGRGWGKHCWLHSVTAR